MKMTRGAKNYLKNIKKSLKSAAKKPAYRSAPKTMIKRVVNSMSETKKHQVEINEQNLSALTSPTSSNYHLLDLIPSGTTYATRIGHKIKAVGIAIRGHVVASSGDPQWIKMAVIRIKDPSVDFLTAGLENNTGNLSPVGGMATIWRRVNTDAFEVLASRVMKVGGAGTSTDQGSKMFKLWVPFNRTVCYDGTSATAPKYNRTFVCFWNADAADDPASGDQCEYTMEATYYFKDM